MSARAPKGTCHDQAWRISGPARGWDDRTMTPDAAARMIPSELADLRSIPLQDMPALAPMTLDRAVQRVLPGRPVKTVARGAAFSSAI